MKYTRRVPSGRSLTNRASRSTLRCWETAGRLTGSFAAITPTGFGPVRSSSITGLIGKVAIEVYADELARTCRERSVGATLPKCGERGPAASLRSEIGTSAVSRTRRQTLPDPIDELP